MSASGQMTLLNIANEIELVSQSSSKTGSAGKRNAKKAQKEGQVTLMRLSGDDQHLLEVSKSGSSGQVVSVF